MSRCHDVRFDWNSSRYGFQENVLNQEMMSKDYKKKDNFAFTDVDYEFKDTMAECDDMLYVCTMINRGDNPLPKGGLEYNFAGSPDESALVGCTGAPECKGQ